MYMKVERPHTGMHMWKRF